jgi:hypothetical protein
VTLQERQQQAIQYLREHGPRELRDIADGLRLSWEYTRWLVYPLTVSGSLCRVCVTKSVWLFCVPRDLPAVEAIRAENKRLRVKRKNAVWRARLRDKQALEDARPSPADQFEHKLVAATEAPPLVKTGPASVWELGRV